MISRDLQARLGSLFEKTVIDAVVSLIFGVLVLSSPVDVDAQGKPDRISLVRQTMEFGSDTLAMTALHLRMTNPVREEAVGEQLAASGRATLGGPFDVMECVERAGADPCRWTGPGNAGGLVVDIGKLEFTSSTTAIVEVTFLRVGPQFSQVYFQDWRIDFEADAGGSWRLVNATLLGES